MVLENGGESIAIGFTDKKLSPHAGSAVFWKFLHPSGFIPNSEVEFRILAELPLKH